MKSLTLSIFFLSCSSAWAQGSLKGLTPPDNANLQVPKGWVLVVPVDEKTGTPKSDFQLPKDWINQRPQGAPFGKDWPSMPPGVVANPIRIDNNSAAFPIFAANSETTDALIKKQTEAIKFLSGRIDKLEARIEELSAQSGKKK